MNALCPQCHSSETIARVSDVYYDCTSTPGKYPRLLWEEPHKPLQLPMDVAMRDELATRLAPPPMPAVQQNDVSEVGLSVAGGVVNFGLDDGFIGMLIALALFATWGLIILMLKFILRMVRRLMGKHPAVDWNTAITHWNTLYYCAACDAVFVPGKRKAIPSKQISAFIYR